jgi:dipeptidase D
MEYRTDEAGNVVIKKAGSKGAAKAAPVILQAHIDMVCEKNKNVEHDFEKIRLNSM